MEELLKTPKYCSYCHKAFVGKTNNLTRHIQEQHSDNEFVFKYKCPLQSCSFKSKWAKNVRQHFPDKHGDPMEYNVSLYELEQEKVPNDIRKFTHRDGELGTRMFLALRPLFERNLFQIQTEFCLVLSEEVCCNSFFQISTNFVLCML